jgi:hypothetical protein
MRKDSKVNDIDLPEEKEHDLIIKTTEKNQSSNDDDLPDRLELSLTKGQKRDLIANAKKLYGLKPSALIKMLLTKEGII